MLVLPAPTPMLIASVASDPCAVGSPVHGPEAAPGLRLSRPSPGADVPPDDGVLSEFLLFVREGKRWVIAPMLVTLVCLSALIVFAEGSAITPFLYVLF